MSTPFPAVAPTSRRITQGQYAVKRFTTIAGTGTTRAYSSQPFNSSMNLEFANISDEVASLIVTAYENARGSYDALTLPPDIWNGIEPGLKARLERDYTWRFAEQPVLTSTAPGVSSMAVRLDGQRDG